MRTAIRNGACSLGLWLCGLTPAGAQTTAPYPAPVAFEAFRFASPGEEIALAKTAAPASISDHAEILTLGPQGYETAVKGENGFVCFVDRSWSKPFDDPQFWNPKVRAPQCANAAAAQSVLPIVLERTRWALAGATRTEMAERTRAAVAARTLATPAPGAMIYMMAKPGYISDGSAPHWHPHLMFYAPLATGATWGAGSPGAPVVSTDDDATKITTLFVMVPKWSDGTSALMDMK